jgi:hypothetical protein
MVLSAGAERVPHLDVGDVDSGRQRLATLDSTLSQEGLPNPSDLAAHIRGSQKLPRAS